MKKANKKQLLGLSVASALVLFLVVAISNPAEVMGMANAFSASAENFQATEKKDKDLFSLLDETSETEITNGNVVSTTPKDPASKPDNGLMTREEMFEYEPHMEKVEDTSKAEELKEEFPELTPEELVMEEILETGRLSGEAVTLEQFVAADEAAYQQRLERAQQNVASGNVDSMPDVGVSNISVIEGKKENSNVASNSVADVVTNGEADKAVMVSGTVSSNGIVTVDKNVSSDNSTVSLGVAESEESKTAKTIVRVYDPNGNKTEYVVEDGNWSDVPLDGVDGEYTINVYQDSDGNGYKQISQSLVTKGEQKKDVEAEEFESTIEDTKPAKTESSKKTSETKSSDTTVVANASTPVTENKETEKTADSSSSSETTTQNDVSETVEPETNTSSDSVPEVSEEAPAAAPEAPVANELHESVSLEDFE